MRLIKPREAQRRISVNEIEWREAGNRVCREWNISPVHRRGPRCHIRVARNAEDGNDG